MKKRVAIIVPGGIGAGNFNQGLPALVNLVTGLGKKFDITVYSMVTVNSDYVPDTFKIKSIKAAQYDLTLIKVVKIIFMILKDHMKKPYDLFHGIWGGASGMIAVILGKLLNRPSIVSLQGGEAASVKSISYGYLIKPQKKKWLFKTLYSADAVTALTKFQVDELKKHGFQKKEIAIIPMGVDTSLFTVSEKNPGPVFHFLHVANLTAVKDQETLLRCFQILKGKIDCKLRIAGPDHSNGKIHELCTDLKLEDYVSFLGPVKNTDLPHHFSWAHILLHTSLYEAQAVVVAEAAASKVLVCGTKTGLISDLENETISVRPGDYESLAEKILSVIKDEKKWQDTIQKGYAWARTYDIHYTINQFADIYNSLLKKISDATT